MALNRRLKSYIDLTELTYEEVAFTIGMTVHELRNFIEHNEGLYAEHIEKLAQSWPEMMAYLFQTPSSACFHYEGVPGVEFQH